MQPSAQSHHARGAIPPAISPRSRAVQRTARMPCLREFHACLAGTLLRGPYASPYSLSAVNLGLFYHINNVIMRKPGRGQALEGGRHFLREMPGRPRGSPVQYYEAAGEPRVLYGRPSRAPWPTHTRCKNLTPTPPWKTQIHKSRGWTNMVYLRMLYG